MSSDTKLLKAAAKLVAAADKAIDEAMPKRLADIVKRHSMLAVGSAWIPLPGADVAASAANIWSMYYRINKELEMPFSDNVIKSVASGVATNLASYMGVLAVGGILKIIPGIGWFAGAAVMSGAIYALTLASGFVYMNALALLLEKNGSSNINEADLRNAVGQVMGDKDEMSAFMRDAKGAYRA